MKKTILLMAGLSLATADNCFAQSKIDSGFIRQHDQRQHLTLFVARKSLELNSDGYKLTPNSPLNIGLGYSIKNTIVNFEASLPLIRVASNEKYGKTNVVDLQVHHFGRRLLVDVFYQNYKGFYNDNRETRQITIYPDIAVQRIGGEALYLFNGGRFSAKAAFQQKERQLHSVGSFLLAGDIFNAKIKNVTESGVTHKTDIENFQIGIGAGYAYSWVMSRHWNMSGFANFGFNTGNEWVEFKKGHLKIYPRASARWSLGYSNKTWGVYLSMHLQNNRIFPLRSKELALTSVNNQLAYIRHFDSFFKKK